MQTGVPQWAQATRLQSFHLARRLIDAIVNDERLMKCADELVGLVMASHIPLLQTVGAFRFDRADQLDRADQFQQHLGQVIEHLATSLADQGEQQRMAPRLYIPAQLWGLQALASLAHCSTLESARARNADVGSGRFCGIDAAQSVL